MSKLATFIVIYIFISKQARFLEDSLKRIEESELIKDPVRLEAMLQIFFENAKRVQLTVIISIKE